MGGHSSGRSALTQVSIESRLTHINRQMTAVEL